MRKPKYETQQAQTIAYLRVSTSNQDTEKNKADILGYCNSRNFGQVRFISEVASGKTPWKKRKLGGVIDGMGRGDRLVVPEMSRLGRSTLEVLQILQEARDKDIAVYSIKEGFQLNSFGIQSKVLSTMLALFSELERDFISLRTREGLASARARGVQLGRKKGPGKSKLDVHREEIISLLKNGTTKRFLSRRFKTTEANLYNWLRKNKIKIEKEV